MERRLRAHSPDGGGGRGQEGRGREGGSDCLKPTHWELAYLLQAHLTRPVRGGPLYEVRLLSVYVVCRLAMEGSRLWLQVIWHSGVEMCHHKCACV